MRRFRHALLLLRHTGGLTFRLAGSCSLFLLHGSFAVVWCSCASSTDGEGGGGGGGIFCLTIAPWSVSLPHKLINSPLSPHAHTIPHTSTGRGEIRLPVSAPSVKLIRLQAPDNSIISGSLDNRVPPPPHECKSSSRTILPNITVFPNSLH